MPNKKKLKALDDLTENGHVLKGNYKDYYVYRKDFLFNNLEMEFELLKSARDHKIQREAEKNNKTPFSTKINEDLGILGN